MSGAIRRIHLGERTTTRMFTDREDYEAKLAEVLLEPDALDIYAGWVYQDTTGIYEDRTTRVRGKLRYWERSWPMVENPV